MRAVGMHYAHTMRYDPCTHVARMFYIISIRSACIPVRHLADAIIGVRKAVIRVDRVQCVGIDQHGRETVRIGDELIHELI